MDTSFWIFRVIRDIRCRFQNALGAIAPARGLCNFDYSSFGAAETALPTAPFEDDEKFQQGKSSDDESPKPRKSNDNKNTANEIIRLLESYSPKTCTLDRVEDRAFEQAIRKAVIASQPLHLVLPAFPFKSPNRIEKVLGPLPDLGDETALARLEGLCADIDKIYPGTTLFIVSDGIIYSDILGVSEAEVWRYGRALRDFAARQNFAHLKFASLSTLLSPGYEEPTTIEEYVQTAPGLREQIVQDYLPPDFDVSKELREQNPLSTYCGYIKFLESDLKHWETRQGLSKSQTKKLNQRVAKKMILRGKAFSNAIHHAFPTAVRLSIHASNSKQKLPLNILPGKHTLTTPWHSVCAVDVDGSMTFAHRNLFANDPDYELVHLNGRPSHFRRRSDLFNLTRIDVDIRPIYPCGLVISPNVQPAPIADLDMKKVRALAQFNSPILLRGFQHARDQDVFQETAAEMGTIMPWKFGDVLVVKDAGVESGGLNNVLSSEAMPMHFDGLFKTAEIIGEDGVRRLVPIPPSFQFFFAVSPSPKDTGITLFASSKNLFENLPKPHTVTSLQPLTWSVQTSAFSAAKLTNLKLIEPHPVSSTPCLRYHEPWGPDKTKFDATDISIENGPQEIVTVLDELLYDRRVCYYHAWEEGDLLVSDNWNMLHTRSEFTSGAPRELWRIHVD